VQTYQLGELNGIYYIAMEYINGVNLEQFMQQVVDKKKKLPIVFIQEEISKAIIPIPIPDITPLNPPLGLIPPIPPKIEPLMDSVFATPLQAVMMGLAEASRSSDAVFGSGSLNVTRYGRILKSRALVGVRGAGDAFDGLYYVKSVTHSIKRGEYKQNFELARNGLVSTIPRVVA